MKNKLLAGAALSAAAAGALVGSATFRGRRESMLHRRAEQFERGQVNSFMIVVVEADGQVKVDFDAGAAGEGSELELAHEFGKLAAGAMQGHDHLMNQVAEIAVRQKAG